MLLYCGSQGRDRQIAARPRYSSRVSIQPKFVGQSGRPGDSRESLDGRCSRRATREEHVKSTYTVPPVAHGPFVMSILPFLQSSQLDIHQKSQPLTSSTTAWAWRYPHL